MGFEYPKYEKNAADQAIVERIMGKAPASLAADAHSPTRRQGAARWSATPKQRTQSAADLPPITPTTRAELDAMTAALTAARKEVDEGKCAKKDLYKRAAALYFAAVTRAHFPPGDPPADLRRATEPYEQRSHQGSR
jgi:hypothetical protein